MLETTTLLAAAYVVLALAVVVLGAAVAGIAVLVRDRSVAVPVVVGVSRADLTRAA